MNFLTRGKHGDWQLPRIRLYSSISDALSGLWLGENLKGAEFYVYKAKGIRQESLIKPGITSIPYALVLDEWWYLRNIGLEYLGKIKVEKKIGEEAYHYGPRSTKAFIFRWLWKEIGLKNYEKSKIMRRKLFSVEEEGKKEKKKRVVQNSILGGTAIGTLGGRLLGHIDTRMANEKNSLLNRIYDAELETEAARLKGLDKVPGKEAAESLTKFQEKLRNHRALKAENLKKAQRAINKKVLIGGAIGAGVGLAGLGVKSILDKRKRKRDGRD